MSAAPRRLHRELAVGATRSVPIWLLVMITLSGTIGMHMFVPALPVAARDMATSAGEMQLTISLYIAGLGVGQLVYGPLSDAFGRRRLLLVGLGLYTAAGAGAALCTGVDALIAARLLQALGGCSGLVLGRAIVRDTARADEAVRKLALLNLMILIGPGLAPMLGGALAGAAGWRYIFLVLATLGALTWMCTWRLLPETARPTGRISAGGLLRDYAALLRSPAFVGYAVGGGCATTAFYAFLAAAPFIFADQLHRPAAELGIYLALLMVGVSVGNTVVARLVRRHAPERLLMAANLLSLGSALALLLVALGGWVSVASVMGLMFVFAMGAGGSSPISMARAISVESHLTGSAAGLYGFAQMSLGAVCTALVSLGTNPSIAAGAVLLLMAAMARAAFAFAMHHERRLARQAA